MPYRSKRQWRWAFATGQDFARRWADDTPGGEGRRFRRLPERATKAEDAEGAAPAPGKKMTPAERAKHAALVRWGKKNPFAQRLEAVRAKKKAGKGKAPAKPKPTAEERAKERELLRQERAAERAQLRKEKAEERAQLRAEKEAAKKPAEAAAPDDKAKAEKEKKGGGGGGGGGKEAKPTEDEKKQKKAEERAQTARDTAEAAGLAPEDADALRSAAEGQGGGTDALRGLGLVGDDGLTTDAGRRALLALERGDQRGYQAALQDVRAAQGREQAKQERAAQSEAARARAKADAEQAAKDAEAERRQAEADEVTALLDDWEAGRVGLSYRDQRRAVRAGLARYDDAGNIRRVKPKETKAVAIKGDDAVGLTEDDLKPRKRPTASALRRERARLRASLGEDGLAMAAALGLAPSEALILELDLLELESTL